MTRQQQITRKIILALLWGAGFFVIALIVCLAALSTLLYMPSAFAGDGDSFSAGAAVAYSLITLQSSQMIWLILFVSFLMSALGTLSAVLPGTDNQSLERYFAEAPRIAFEEEKYYCKNCGALVNERFCGICGQEKYMFDVTMKEFATGIVPEIINIDKRFFKSLWDLISKPGYLTLEYLKFHRVPHAPPTQIYFVIATVFFFVGVNLDFNIGTITEQIPYFAAKVELTAKTEQVPKTVVLERINNVLERYIPFYTFFMVVLFGFILKLLYRSFVYVKHIIFALHFIAAFLSFWILTILMLTVIPWLHNAINDSIVLVPSSFYLWRSLRAVYLHEPSWKAIPAILTFIILFFVYVVVSLLIGIILL
jgi:hypothetical protein